ncbi:unnamed protein product [Lymnaea stagnalis]|uniref:Uncharacterized protein n=1 Tax=Lymnaea stagnalis TaxID=6523 RepID=A0AAV2H772_LYMST
MGMGPGGTGQGPRACRGPHVSRRLFLIDYRGLSSLTYHQSGRGVCEWSDVGNIAFDVHAGKLKVCVNGVWRDIKVKSDKRRLDYLVPHQVLDTGQGSLDVEVFDLPGEGKFAVFALTDARDQSSLRSRMYQWVNGQFTFYQWLPTQSAQSWEFFSIHSQFFLAVANYGSLKSVPSNSTIFKWNKKSRKFVVYQNIQTYTARDIEAFEINGDYYLAIANHAQNGNSLIDSVVYKWSW